MGDITVFGAPAGLLVAAGGENVELVLYSQFASVRRNSALFFIGNEYLDPGVGTGESLNDSAVKSPGVVAHVFEAVLRHPRLIDGRARAA